MWVPQGRVVLIPLGLRCLLVTTPLRYRGTERKSEGAFGADLSVWVTLLAGLDDVQGTESCPENCFCVGV